LKSEFSEGLAPVQIDYKWKFVDKTDKSVVPPNCEIGKFVDGIAKLKNDDYCNSLFL